MDGKLDGDRHCESKVFKNTQEHSAISPVTVTGQQLTLESLGHCTSPIALGEALFEMEWSSEVQNFSLTFERCNNHVLWTRAFWDGITVQCHNSPSPFLRVCQTDTVRVKCVT